MLSTQSPMETISGKAIAAKRVMPRLRVSARAAPASKAMTRNGCRPISRYSTPPTIWLTSHATPSKNQPKLASIQSMIDANQPPISGRIAKPLG
jgi:hypothetical protein